MLALRIRGSSPRPSHGVQAANVIAQFAERGLMAAITVAIFQERWPGNSAKDDVGRV